MTSSNSCPVDHSAAKAECPIDHTSTASATWSKLASSSAATVRNAPLSNEREVSSIPRASDGNWVYPSEAQFFAAMARKNHDPKAGDMKTIVPIHNAVNERAWTQIQEWEAGRGGDKCGGVRLVNFKGRPGDRTPKAWAKVLLGYSAPFDRHDWIVDRCGQRVRYVIDFYTGHSEGQNVSFYLDVRPAMDSFEGMRMRAGRVWQRLFG